MRCVLADVPGQHVPYQVRDHQPNGSAGKLANGNGRWCAIIARRRLSCFLVTDDRDAARLATRNGIAVTSTWRLLQLAHRRKWIDADTLWGYVQTLKVHNRGTPPGVRDRTAFDKWLPA